MSRRPQPAADGPVVDGIVDGEGGIQHRQAGVSEVAMDVGFSELGEQLAPTTTITTVAVQAGKAKIVLAILKVRPAHWRSHREGGHWGHVPLSLLCPSNLLIHSK